MIVQLRKGWDDGNSSTLILSLMLLLARDDPAHIVAITHGHSVIQKPPVRPTAGTALIQ
jgi:hypothetical protein